VSFGMKNIILCITGITVSKKGLPGKRFRFVSDSSIELSRTFNYNGEPTLLVHCFY